VSEERLQKVGETYRVIRNALRYQLSNLYDFDPARHTVADERLTGLDRWILGEFSMLEADCARAYDACEYHVVYQRVAQFAAVQLSAVYHDAVKDRLYTDPAGALRRRSTQTALYRLVTGLCQVLAPVLVFTADEAWEFVPGRPASSVHLSDWTPRTLERSEGERSTWEWLFATRERILPELETARRAKLIGKALEARVAVTLPGPLPALEPGWEEALRELANVSQLEVRTGPAGSEVTVAITRAEGTKCERCWHCETDIGVRPEHPTLCGRCAQAVS